MSGFGYGGQSDLIRQLTQQIQNAGGQSGTTTTPPTTPAPVAGAGPGEPNNMNYGGMGTYNTLTQDMSRNRMGGWGFGGGMFNYNPYGNPYGMPQQQPYPWYPGNNQFMGGGYGGGFGGYSSGYGGGGFGGYGQPMAYGNPYSGASRFSQRY